MTNAYLRKSFRIYNRRYFDNKIPPSTVVVFGDTLKDSDGNFFPGENKIAIDKALRCHNSLVMICLLHEMAHAKLQATYVGGTTNKDPHHGMLYQAELVRLFQAGAYDGLL